MEWLKISILAVIQGITEFLPISSSGHLVLCKHFIGLEATSGSTLVIVLHAGTLLSILIFYRRRVKNLFFGIISNQESSKVYTKLLILGILPAIICAILGRNYIEIICNKPSLVAIFLIINGIYLLVSSLSKRYEKKILPLSAFAIGIAQMFALIPGISRSGSTICTARMFGIAPRDAAEFSFLMSIPLLIGVVIYEGLNWLNCDALMGISSWVLAWGFLVSAFTGYLALSWLVSLLERGQFWYFGVYCLVAGILSINIL